MHRLMLASRTVPHARAAAVAPTLQGVLVLGLIVVIRTFLSMALEVELEGRWPWQRANATPTSN